MAGQLFMDKRIQKFKRNVDVEFFKKWTPAMAYVLGYFAADGGMFVNSGGSKYIQFVSTDIELLEKVKKLLKSRHKIALKKKYNQKCKNAFLLQIGCKDMYEDLISLCFNPNKKSRLKLPHVPPRHLRHFIRGYFDGDGSIMHGYFRRKDRNNRKTPYILSCFVCANTKFLKEVSKILTKTLGTNSGYIDKRGTHLYYSKKDSARLFNYMYNGVTEQQYLERKYSKFLKALET